MLLLVLLAAIGLGPAAPSSLGPVPEPPHFEAAVGHAQPLRSQRAELAADRVVAPGARRVGRSVARPTGSEGEPALAVAPAQTVAVAAGPAVPVSPAPEGGAGEEVAGMPDAGAPAGGTPSPVSTPLPGSEGEPAGPTIAGVEIESCEGDEYLITIALAPQAKGAEESVEIVLTRFNADGSVDELHLEGDLLDAQNLALQLNSEGDCVAIEASTPEGTDEGDGAEVSPEAEVPAESESP